MQTPLDRKTYSIYHMQLSTSTCACGLSEAALNGRVQAACSATASFCLVKAGGQAYAWGKWKTSGDNTMYPKPFQDLSGWTVKSFAAGAAHYAVSAHYQNQKSSITW